MLRSPLALAAFGIVAATALVETDRALVALFLIVTLTFLPLGDARRRSIVVGAMALAVIDASARGTPPTPLVTAHMQTIDLTVIRGEIRMAHRSTSSDVASMDRSSARRSPRRSRWANDSGSEASSALWTSPAIPANRRNASWQPIEESSHAVIHPISPCVGRRPDGRDPTLWLASWRESATAAIHRYVAEPAATILVGALLGERDALSSSLREDFQTTGTMHVLVTAGLHVGAVAAAVGWLVEGCAMGRIASALVPLPILWLYVLVSGAHLPAVRAATMATMWLVARAAGREHRSSNGFALAAIVVTSLWPHAVIEPSFALSFASVGAILLLAAPIGRWMRERRSPAWLAEGAALTLATQIGTWPLTASIFLVIAPYAVLANVLVVPLIAIALPLGLALVVFSPISAVAQPLGTLTTTLLDAVTAIVRGVASFPHARLPATPPPVWTVALYAVVVALLPALWDRGRRRIALALLGGAALLVLEPPRLDRHELVVEMIDVGQGEAIAIRTPGGHAFLVDAGGIPERIDHENADHAPTGGDDATEDRIASIGESTVVPALVRLSVSTISTPSTSSRILMPTTSAASFPCCDSSGRMPSSMLRNRTVASRTVPRCAKPMRVTCRSSSPMPQTNGGSTTAPASRFWGQAIRASIADRASSMRTRSSSCSNTSTSECSSPETPVKTRSGVCSTRASICTPTSSRPATTEAPTHRARRFSPPFVLASR